MNEVRVMFYLFPSSYIYDQCIILIIYFQQKTPFYLSIKQNVFFFLLFLTYYYLCRKIYLLDDDSNWFKCPRFSSKKNGETLILTQVFKNANPP